MKRGGEQMYRRSPLWRLRTSRLLCTCVCVYGRTQRPASDAEKISGRDLNFAGTSKTAATLHVVSILLKLGRSWNWFIELSALDYPLITQDALTLSFLRLWLESTLKCD
ncbi:hypothetical protein DY000_02031910 [Brassica cretica]|uniref:Secreted protein n=1 Tax=Brassica cretica TaxID=69181 RepID=A0ABQ7DG26_BRACR|nr:hypothetical protein DY000_02031910 [Brassica cretica]